MYCACRTTYTFSGRKVKVLVIPDVHLKPWIFDGAAEIMKKGSAEKAVCLMEIPDDWGKEYDLGLYEDTFDVAIRFQRAFPDTLWCYGNHDLSYVSGEKKRLEDIADEMVAIKDLKDRLINKHISEHAQVSINKLYREINE